MEITMTVPPGLAASKTLTEGKDAAGVLTRAVLTDARDLAGNAGVKAQEKAHDLAVKGSERYGKQARHQAKKARHQAKKLERRAERLARKLPVDTPIDERRRRRTARRSARSTFFVLATVGALVAVYFAWKRQQSTIADDEKPDAFGAAVDKSGNGRVARHAPVG
jgi:hypothetical protein